MNVFGLYFIISDTEEAREKTKAAKTHQMLKKLIRLMASEEGWRKLMLLHFIYLQFYGKIQTCNVSVVVCT